MGLTAREYALILQSQGPDQAELCAAGQCAHPHGDLVDLRCPEGPEGMGKLLGRTRPVFYADGVVELACGNCARQFRRGRLPVARVLHRYNLLGELLATEIIPGP